MTLSVRFGADASQQPVDYVALERNVKALPTEIQHVILDHLSRDKWEKSVDKVLAQEIPSREALDELHLISAYQNADVTQKTSNKSSVLIEAIRKNSPVMFNWFLNMPMSNQKKQALLNQADPSGATALQTAILKNRPQTVKQLLKEGAKPTLKDAYITAYHGKLGLLDKTLLPAFEPAFMDNANLDSDGEVKSADVQRDELIALCKSQKRDIDAHKALSQEQKNNSLHFRIEQGTHTPASILSLVLAGADINSRVGHSKKTALHKAVESGQIEIVDALLTHGAKVNSESASGKTALTYAIRAANPGMVKLLLSYQPTMSIPPARSYYSNTGYTSFLHQAVESGDNAILEMVLAHYPEIIRQTDDNSRTALHYAAHSGNLEATKLLARHAPGQISVKDYRGQTPVHEAVSGRNADVLASLLEFNPEFAKLTDSDTNTPLHVAAKVDNGEMIDLLVKNDPAGLSRRNYDRRTPLHEAARLGKVNSVNAILLHKPSDVSRVDRFGKTPLHYAIESGSKEIVSALLAYEPELINVRQSDKSHILHYVAKIDHLKPDIFEMILSQGAHLLEQENEEGKTPLYTAVAKNNINTVEQYLKYNKGLANIADKECKLPLHVALMGENARMIEFLLQASPGTVNQRDGKGKTPLYIAVERQNSEFAKLLLDHGATVDKLEPEKGRTALHMACANKDVETVKVLLKHQPALGKVVDHSGQTPKKLAYELKARTEREAIELKKRYEARQRSYSYYSDSDGYYSDGPDYRRAQEEVKALNDILAVFTAYEESTLAFRPAGASSSAGKRESRHKRDKFRLGKLFRH